LVQIGIPMPVLATIGLIFMELPVAFAIRGKIFDRCLLGIAAS
jgi:hypothetical protein